MKPLACFVFALGSAAIAQNDVLYYKFEGGGNIAVNYAVNSPAPSSGPVINTLTTAPTASFVNGQYGQALNGGIAQTPYQANHVSTGWAPNVTGDYTWAMWLNNQRGNPGPSLTYLAGIPTSGAFRIYGGSSTLLTVGNAGGSTYYRTIANVYQMATAGWVHVAFVVDTVAMTTTYYINGVAEAPVALTALPNIQGTEFNVGRQTLTNAPSIYDIDEFRFQTRAASAAEIAFWASQHPAADSAFASGCDATLRSSNGLPQFSNFLYQFDVSAQVPNTFGLFAFGLQRAQSGPVALPLDLGTLLPGMSGCEWHCSADATTLMVLDGAGNGTVGFPILPDPAFDKFAFYVQGIFFGGPRGQMTTNPFSVVIGN
jgi:hypothetical protein